MNDPKSTLISCIQKHCKPILPDETGESPRFEPIQGIRAVLFDVYGTLLVSSTGDLGVHENLDHETAFRQSIDALGLTWVDDDPSFRCSDVLKEMIQAHQNQKRREGIEYPEVEILMVWHDTIEALQSKEIIQNGMVSIADLQRLAVEYECRVNPVWPMPDFLETIKSLKERGLTLGIVSNAQFYTPLMFEAFIGKSPEKLGFENTCCVWSYQLLEGKPSLTLFKKAAEALMLRGIQPQDTLYVGNDMLKDIWTASQVGFRTVFFAGDRNSLRKREDDPRCQSLMPGAVVTSLNQLLEILSQ